jgi:hypothetical protein
MIVIGLIIIGIGGAIRLIIIMSHKKRKNASIIRSEDRNYE